MHHGLRGRGWTPLATNNNNVVSRYCLHTTYYIQRHNYCLQPHSYFVYRNMLSLAVYYCLTDSLLCVFRFPVSRFFYNLFSDLIWLFSRPPVPPSSSRLSWFFRPLISQSFIPLLSQSFIPLLSQFFYTPLSQFFIPLYSHFHPLLSSSILFSPTSSSSPLSVLHSSPSSQSPSFPLPSITN